MAIQHLSAAQIEAQMNQAEQSPQQPPSSRISLTRFDLSAKSP